jgi:integration host factor subunit beta
MSKPKFTRSRIQEILRSGAGLEPAQARTLTNRIIGAMAAALAAGETVELRGLGSLDVRERAGRRGCNPKTGEPVDVPPRRCVFFIPGQELKATLRKSAEKPGPCPSPECP